MSYCASIYGNVYNPPITIEVLCGISREQGWQSNSAPSQLEIETQRLMDRLLRECFTSKSPETCRISRVQDQLVSAQAKERSQPFRVGLAAAQQLVHLSSNFVNVLIALPHDMCSKRPAPDGRV